MNSNRYFKGNKRRDTHESSNLIDSQNRRHRDFGSEYSPISPDNAQKYGDDVRLYFANIRSSKRIDQAFDIIQSEKNFLMENGDIRGKHQEIYNIIDRLQDAVLDENQQDIADIISSVRIASRTSQRVRESLDSILHEMANTSERSLQRNSDQLYGNTKQNQTLYDTNQDTRHPQNFSIIDKSVPLPTTEQAYMIGVLDMRSTEEKARQEAENKLRRSQAKREGYNRKPRPLQQWMLIHQEQYIHLPKEQKELKKKELRAEWENITNGMSLEQKMEIINGKVTLPEDQRQRYNTYRREKTTQKMESLSRESTATNPNGQN